MKILVIGGTGYIGKIMVERLLERGDRVSIFSRGASKPHWWDRIEHIQGDRAEHAEFEAKLKGKVFDAVIDTQAYRKEDMESAEAAFLGTVGRYLMVSTGSVYLEGKVDFFNRCPYNESAVDWRSLEYNYPQGEDPYAVGKRHCEKWLLENSRMAYTIIRIPAVMGWDDPTGRMWWWVQRALDGGPVVIPAESRGAFRTLYSADAAVNFIRILDAPNTVKQTYYIAMPEIITMERWANLIWRAAGHQCQITYVPSKVIHSREPLKSYSPPLSRPVSNIHDLSKAEQAFGIESTPVEQWVQATVDWYRENQPGESSVGYAAREDEVALAAQWEEGLGKLSADF